jgi:hypothetical protein
MTRMAATAKISEPTEDPILAKEREIRRRILQNGAKEQISHDGSFKESVLGECNVEVERFGLVVERR